MAAVVAMTLITTCVIMTSCVVIVLAAGGTYLRPRYLAFLPTFPDYPSSRGEVAAVKRIRMAASPDEIAFFRATDQAGCYPTFVEAFPECFRGESNLMYNGLMSFCMMLKVLYNRPRPYQVDSEVDPEPSVSARSPAYPSGHALEAYFYARQVAKRCPERTAEAYALADKCARARVHGGVHYPSDGAFSKRLALSIPDFLVV